MIAILLIFECCLHAMYQFWAATAQQAGYKAVQRVGQGVYPATSMK